MKKMIFLLTLLLLVTPAMAQKCYIWAECVENPDMNDEEPNFLVNIYYDTNDWGDPCEIRAIALDQH